MNQEHDWCCDCDKCNKYWNSLNDIDESQSNEIDEEKERELDQDFQCNGW